MKTHLKQMGLLKWIILSFMAFSLSFFMMGCGDSKKQVTSVDKADQDAEQGNAGADQDNAQADQDDAGNDQGNMQTNQDNAGNDQGNMQTNQGNAGDGQNADTEGADQGNAGEGQSTNNTGTGQNASNTDLTNSSNLITIQCSCFRTGWFINSEHDEKIELETTRETLEQAKQTRKSQLKTNIDNICKSMGATYGKVDTCVIL